jgi:hypothetical protein
MAGISSPGLQSSSQILQVSQVLQPAGRALARLEVFQINEIHRDLLAFNNPINSLESC